MKDVLETYYKKRSAERTPEPFGSTGVSRPRQFVVHKHWARRMHYDLRLEMGNVLVSWAVPRGPSFDPAIKRLAVKVEEHPIEYVDFEGLIPEGNYGAGAMIVWDRGQWIPLEEPETGVEAGKLLFELRGYKLRGVFTLVKTKGESNEWLLIKKPDEWAVEEGTRAVPQESILSGLTVEELKKSGVRVASVATAVNALDAPVAEVDFSELRPMLADHADAAFSDPDWIYELKLDGFRLMAAKDESMVKLRYRSGIDSTNVFPDVVRALRALPYPRMILDGEVVVLDDEGRPSFQRLQKRVQLQRALDIDRATVQHPATYYAFDLLAYGDRDLRGLPLVERKRILRKMLAATGVLRYSDHIEARGEAFFEQVKNMSLEGIVAKKASSTYQAGRRSPDWKKIRIQKTDDFVVVGYTHPQGTRTGIGGLQLAQFEGGQLVYAGSVGTGFSHDLLNELGAHLEARRRKDAPCVGKPLRPRQTLWVEPDLVVEVRFLHRTEERLLRHPVFERIRSDKTVESLREEEPPPFDEDELVRPPTADEAAAGAEPPEAAASRKVPFTNLDKVFWDEHGYTKGDLIEFYRSISSWILPYLTDRPLVLTRYPDGIDGKNFFQKDAPPFIPGWIRTERRWSEHAQREIDYFVCDDEETLLYIINLGSIPLHVWSSRVADLAHPDWTILDLDPKGAPFTDVVKLARAIHDLCDDLELPCFPKTSGASGLHVLIPLGRQCDFEQSRGLAELMARVIATEHPDISTITRQVGARGGRVYLDFLQNGNGRLLVSPLCVRPVPAASVSTPLTWDEVNKDLDPKNFTIRTVRARMEAKGDPMLPVLELKPNLSRALENLAQRMKG